MYSQSNTNNKENSNDPMLQCIFISLIFALISTKSAIDLPNRDEIKFEEIAQCAIAGKNISSSTNKNDTSLMPTQAT